MPRRLGCDASVVRIIERDGRLLSVGRRARTIAPALRRALRSRDRGCRFPGCTHTKFLHAHHIQHWARGGRTDLTNLVHLCSYHHRLVHEGGFCVEWGATRELVFRRRDGRRICEAPSPTRARGPGIVEGNHESSLVIDEWTCMPRPAGNQLDYGIAVEGLMAEVLAGS